MEAINGLQDKIINLDVKGFDEVALTVFRFQAESNAVYREFISHLEIDPQDVTNVDQIPFLPLELFKIKQVITGNWNPEMVFTSSGTGTSGISSHFIRNLDFYRQISLKTFSNFYGSPDRYHILALLPSYLERTGSSLVFMLEHFIKESDSSYSGFYLKDQKRLINQLRQIQDEGDRTAMLWGVSFALLDLAEKYPYDLSKAVVIETGGMKGRRKEIIREELHGKLQNSFNISQVHSEYGMAELTSQAYSLNNGLFQTPPWMKVMIRDISDPFSLMAPDRAGGINIIDLANIHSCSFIETQDLGEVNNNGAFKILGRLDNSDVRGCNLLLE